MRAHAVVGVFLAAQLAIERGRLIGVRVHLVELFVMRAVGALDMGVQFWGLWRKHEQRQLLLLAGQFEFGGELAAAIHL